jgi:hypothetical protein
MVFTEKLNKVLDLISAADSLLDEARNAIAVVRRGRLFLVSKN